MLKQSFAQKPGNRIGHWRQKHMEANCFHAAAWKKAIEMVKGLEVKKKKKKRFITGIS